ncbi:MAG: alkaline phosphatase family protein [Acidimicrobiales bacterium]
MRRPVDIDDLHRVESALTDPAHADAVDMVMSRAADDIYRVASETGTVEFVRTVVSGTDRDGGHVERYDYAVVSTSGTDPLARRSAEHDTDLSRERSAPRPHRDDNTYPHAFDQIAQFFDAPHAPDLLVQHTAAHRYGGNVGQHGSLGIVQARAPFVASGAGVATRGTVATSARMIDVAPTVLTLLGVSPHPSGIGPTGARRPDALLARQDGDVMDEVVSGEVADHVVIVLLDGCNANVLDDAVRSGLAPTIAALAHDGTTLGGGLLASLPTATLANHTTASTGAHPGHSGVLHNMWHDRATGIRPDLLALDQVFDAMCHLRPGIESIHHALHRHRPDAFTASLFELCDAGADVSSFEAFRVGAPPALPPADATSGAHEGFVAASGSYSFMSSVDELATRQAVDLWDRRDGNPLPTLTFLALSLTDEAGHEAGPYGEMTAAAIADSDARIARLVEAVDRAGARGSTAFLVMADHGMQESAADNDATWEPALAGAGPDAHGRRPVDVADGFVYFLDHA